MNGFTGSGDRRWVSSRLIGGLLLLVLVGGLVTYKSVGAIRQLESARVSGAVTARADVVPVAPVPSLGVVSRSVNYLSVIWPALVFGLLISAAVRAFVPVAALSRVFDGGSFRGQVIAGASGAPLMLCSCCAAPVFSSVYGRSPRLGPSLALMVAAPALNPAALALTFLLFSSQIAWSRVGMSVVAVFLGTAVVARLAGRRRSDTLPETTGVAVEPSPERGPLANYLQSFTYITIRTVPLIVVGVVVAMGLSDLLPASIQSSSAGAWTIALAASLALPLALPTFFEIPLAVAVLAAGAPAGAAAAVLFAGPAVNLPSLLTVGQIAGWKPMALCASMVWLVAVVGGIIIG